jgi:type II secretory pathway pseudopilin PulG
MVESLVAVVLLGVIGLGMAHALGRTLVASKFHKAQSLAVQGLRAELQTAGMAQGCPASGSGSHSSSLSLGPDLSIDDVDKHCQVLPVTVSAPGGPSGSTRVVQLRYELSADTLLGPGTLTLEN